MAASRSALSRQIALDHILRRLIQQNPRQPGSVQLWNSIARLIPGVTVQHCIQRWQDLCEELSAVRNQTQLEAMGRPISSQPRVHSTRSVHQLSHSSSSSLAASPSQPGSKEGASAKKMKMADAKPAAVEHGGASKEGRAGTEVCNDAVRDAKTADKDSSEGDTLPTFKSTSSSTVLEEVCTPHGTDTASTTTAAVDSLDSQMVTIHVCDDAKNVKQDFVCSRPLLAEEMVYFANYLSGQPSEGKSEAEIAVHCDVAIFTWLMSYVKRGMNEDPFGKATEQPQETPTLSPEIVISVLISSEFLKMAALVEMCLEFLHVNLSAVLSTKCNVSSIPDHLVVRLAHKFTPMELETIQDKRDKFRNKLYLQKLVDLFKPSFSTSYSPCNAADLYRCLHCHTLLTVDQETNFPCSPKRVSVTEEGEVVYLHQVDPQWEVNSYLSQLLARGRSIREVYWTVWGVVNTLVCSCCGQLFQCRHLHQRCCCHPISPVPGPEGTSGLVYPCCGRRQQSFRLLRTQPDGCQLQDHCVTAVDGAAGGDDVASVLLAHQDMICVHNAETPGDMSGISSQPTLHNLLSSTLAKTQHSDFSVQLIYGACMNTHTSVIMTASCVRHSRRPKAAKHLRAQHTANPVLWDPKRTIRWNQDRQREQDQHRIRELTKQLREMASRGKLTV